MTKEEEQAVALLEEVVANASKGAMSLYAWYCGEERIIKNTIKSITKKND